MRHGNINLVGLANLMHLARTALAGTPAASSPYQCMLWASKEYARANPDITSTAAYKALDRDRGMRAPDPPRRRRRS